MLTNAVTGQARVLLYRIKPSTWRTDIQADAMARTIEQAIDFDKTYQANPERLKDLKNYLGVFANLMVTTEDICWVGQPDPHSSWGELVQFWEDSKNRDVISSWNAFLDLHHVTHVDWNTARKDGNWTPVMSKVLKPASEYGEEEAKELANPLSPLDESAPKPSAD